MYTSTLGLVLGFHGCDKEVAKNVISGQAKLKKSENDYDWLGHGLYFWENNPKRALDYARFLKKTPSRARQEIRTPAVLGAVIDLGHCLNLLEAGSLKVIKQGYEALFEVRDSSGVPLPVNETPDGGGAPLRRMLDCQVVQMTHAVREDMNEPPYDSVRAVFVEGSKLYDGAGFNEKNHIQICVRNPNCIKGFFLVRKFDKKWPRV